MVYMVSVISILVSLISVSAMSAQAAMSGTSDAIALKNAPTPQIVPASLPSTSATHAKAEPSVRRFDGTWTVRTSPGCLTLPRSTFTISNGRVSGPSTTGRIDAQGNVRSVARSPFLTIVSTGRATESSGFGTYRQSDGCSGTWTSVRR